MKIFLTIYPILFKYFIFIHACQSDYVWLKRLILLSFLFPLYHATGHINFAKKNILTLLFVSLAASSLITLSRAYDYYSPDMLTLLERAPSSFMWELADTQLQLLILNTVAYFVALIGCWLAAHYRKIPARLLEKK